MASFVNETARALFQVIKDVAQIATKAVVLFTLRVTSLLNADLILGRKAISIPFGREFFPTLFSSLDDINRKIEELRVITPVAANEPTIHRLKHFLRDFIHFIEAQVLLVRREKQVARIGRSIRESEFVIAEAIRDDTTRARALAARASSLEQEIADFIALQRSRIDFKKVLIGLAGIALVLALLLTSHHKAITSDSMPKELLGIWATTDGERMVVHKRDVISVHGRDKFLYQVSDTQLADDQLRITYAGSDEIGRWTLGDGQFTILNSLSKSDKNKVYENYPPGPRIFTRSSQSEADALRYAFTLEEWVRKAELFEEEEFRDREIHRYIDKFDIVDDLGQTVVTVQPKSEITELPIERRTRIYERILAKSRVSEHFANCSLAPWILITEGYPYTPGASVDRRVGDVPAGSPKIQEFEFPPKAPE